MTTSEVSVPLVHNNSQRKGKPRISGLSDDVRGLGLYFASGLLLPTSPFSLHSRYMLTCSWFSGKSYVKLDFKPKCSALFRTSPLACVHGGLEKKSGIAGVERLVSYLEHRLSRLALETDDLRLILRPHIQPISEGSKEGCRVATAACHRRMIWS